MAEKNDTRYRNWATVVYPESAPENWLDLLQGKYIPGFVSPLHNKDQNPTGEDKKAHYHVLFLFEGKKSKNQVQEIVDLINGVGLEHINSIRGYARYLCHLDNPEKAQYDINDVRCLSGADYIHTIGLVTDKYKAIREMMSFCVDNDIYAFSDLLIYCSLERDDWFRVLCDNGTFVIKEFLKSRTWKKFNLNQSEDEI
jgi:hypothetical protein